jgi:tetratricopeptide (TPR) repeat protein
MGDLLDGIYGHYRALPILKEAYDLLSRHLPLPRDQISTFVVLTHTLGKSLRECGRLDEAAVVFMRGVEAQKGLRVGTVDVLPCLGLVTVLVDTGKFAEALLFGQEAERLIEADTEALEIGQAMVWGRQSILWASMGAAFEGLGLWEECLEYHSKAMTLFSHKGISTPESMTSFDRAARMFCAAGDVNGAVDMLKLGLKNYKQQLNSSAGLVIASTGFMKLFPPLRQLVELSRRSGQNEEEAATMQALEQDLDETEAIIRSLMDSALGELRDELRAEA